MSRLRRILFGEKLATRQWTVYYDDRSFTTKVLKALFGLKGSHRIDCDYIVFGSNELALILLVIKEESGTRGINVWMDQVDMFTCNWGMSEIIETAENLAVSLLNAKASADADDIYN